MAERVADMANVELRLQTRMRIPGIGWSDHGGTFRFARPNGWHCGCWHSTIDQAAECIELKLWKP